MSRGGFGLDLREHVGWRIRVVVVARFSREPARNPAHDSIEDREHVGGGWHRVHREPKALPVVDEHAIGDDDVEVDVQVDQPTEPLDKHDRPGPRCTQTTRPRDREAQWLGHGEYPLPIRRARQHASDEMRRGIAIRRARDSTLLVAIF